MFATDTLGQVEFSSDSEAFALENMHTIVSRPGVNEYSIGGWHDFRSLVSRVDRALVAATIIGDESICGFQRDPARRLREQPNEAPIQLRTIAILDYIPIRTDV